MIRARGSKFCSHSLMALGGAYRCRPTVSSLVASFEFRHSSFEFFPPLKLVIISEIRVNHLLPESIRVYQCPSVVENPLPVVENPYAQ